MHKITFLATECLDCWNGLCRQAGGLDIPNCALSDNDCIDYGGDRCSVTCRPILFSTLYCEHALKSSFLAIENSECQLCKVQCLRIVIGRTAATRLAAIECQLCKVLDSSVYVSSSSLATQQVISWLGQHWPYAIDTAVVNAVVVT